MSPNCSSATGKTRKKQKAVVRLPPLDSQIRAPAANAVGTTWVSGPELAASAGSRSLRRRSTQASPGRTEAILELADDRAERHSKRYGLAPIAPHP